MNRARHPRSRLAKKNARALALCVPPARLDATFADFVISSQRISLVSAEQEACAEASDTALYEISSERRRRLVRCAEPSALAHGSQLSTVRSSTAHQRL
eukprot:6209929-Pleurochrysis_carterae.AAC.3